MQIFDNSSFIDFFRGKANIEARYNFEDRFRFHSYTFKAKMGMTFWLDLLKNANISTLKDITYAYHNLDIDLEYIITLDDVMEYSYLNKR